MPLRPAADQRFPPGAPKALPVDPYEHLGVQPLINACGIYTDLGGSTLPASVWVALASVNSRWASMLDLLDKSGERIASIVGTEAARVVPGASSAIALCVAACIARTDDIVIETLPQADHRPRTVLQQVVHRYKYTRCALLGGGAIRKFGDATGTSEADLAHALADDRVIAILHPAHLDTVPGGLPLETVAEGARLHDVPVIVDAAYQVYPTALMGSFASRGADLTCVSSKYFFGPNAGGFIAGHQDLVERIATLDFTEFESGPFRTFGRAFKLDRTTIVATTLALERWVTLDHQSRLASYERRAHALIHELRERGLAPNARTCCFTLDERIEDEPVNAVLVPTSSPGETARALAQGSRAVRCVDVADGVLFSMECVEDDEVTEIADALVRAGAGGRTI